MFHFFSHQYPLLRARGIAFQHFLICQMFTREVCGVPPVISAPEASRVESFQSKLWIQKSRSQGTGNGLIITNTQRGKLLKYKRIWFYLRDHWTISLFSVNNITFPFTKETPSTHHIMLNILICQFVGH